MQLARELESLRLSAADRNSAAESKLLSGRERVAEEQRALDMKISKATEPASALQLEQEREVGRLAAEVDRLRQAPYSSRGGSACTLLELRDAVDLPRSRPSLSGSVCKASHVI